MNVPVKSRQGIALLAMLLAPIVVAPLWLLTASPTLATPLSNEKILAALTLPRVAGSVRFAVMGDNGTGEPAQYEVASQMAAFHAEFPFDFVLMLGDNIYGGDSPAEMKAKFEAPYKPLLDAGVTFHAALGNHDNPNQRFYKPFNMGGERYYTFRAPKGGDVRFFVLDTDYVDKVQLDWLEKELSASNSAWKIVYFHHPLYSSARFHGPALETRAVLEPLFVKYGVHAVFSGHEHVYERTKPQKGGIVYWISGAGGQLRKGDVRPSAITAKSFDADQHFMLIEIVGDDLHYQAVSRTGVTVDSGVLHRFNAPAVASSPAPVPVVVPVTASSVPATSHTTAEGAPSPQLSPPPSPTPSPSPSPAPIPVVAPVTSSPVPAVRHPTPRKRPTPRARPRRGPTPSPTPRKAEP